MNKITNLLFIMMLFTTNAMSQKKGDLVFAKKIIKKIDQSGVYLNPNKQELNLSEKEAYQLSLGYLRNIYGYWKIRSQRPHKVVKIDDFWIIYGSLKKNKKGGIFTIAINSKNGCVEYMSHGK